MRTRAVLKGTDLAVVHVALGGVVTEQAVHHDRLLTLGKPAILAAEPVAGLRGSGRHEAPGEDADDQSKDTLDQEQPLPPGPAIDTAHLQDASREERSDNVDGGQGGPEPGKTGGQFARLVEVGEPEHDVGDKPAHQQAQQGLDGVETSFVLEEGLRTGRDRPTDHDEGNPSIGAELLANKTTGEFGREEGSEENRLAVVEVVGVHACRERVLVKETAKTWLWMQERTNLGKHIVGD